MSTLLWQLDPNGTRLTPWSFSDPKTKADIEKYFPNCDKHGDFSRFYRGSATNIYRTKDGRWFHLHGILSSQVLV